MADIFAQVTLLALSGDTADNQVNGFAITEDGGPSEAELDSWAVAIKTFYEGVKAVGGMKGLAQNSHLVKFYDILGAAPNYPIYETTFNFTAAPSAIDLPLEVSLAVSYRNTVLNSVPRARRRGRIYLSGMGEGQNTTGRPISTLYEGCATAYADYVADVNAIGTFEAGVWSRTDQVVYPIDEVWCDNEWDTQRRRGSKATTRFSVSV